MTSRAGIPRDYALAAERCNRGFALRDGGLAG
jgi:hypothetical protein